MSKPIRLLTVCALMLIGVSCATSTPYDPFVKTKDEIKHSMPVLAMRPVMLAEFSRHDEVATRYEMLVTEQLESAGFTVIPSNEFAAVWDPMVEQLGGLYDPITGETDTEKLDAARQHTTNELIAKFSINGFVAPRIDVTKAGWYGNTATWDGVKDETTGKGGFWASLAAANFQGSVPALSLIVPIYDTNGDAVYVGRGGIQLFAHFKGGKFIDVPESMWFVEPERDANAALIAMRELVADPATPVVSKTR